MGPFKQAEEAGLSLEMETGRVGILDVDSFIILN
jgi:hypothetical protein